MRGHYFCYIKLDCGQWCRYDDEQIKIIGDTIDISVRQKAYILFYVKKNISDYPGNNVRETRAVKGAVKKLMFNNMSSIDHQQ